MRLRNGRLGVRAVLEFALLTVLPGAVAFAAAMDLFTMTIPNRISLVAGGARFFCWRRCRWSRALANGAITSAPGFWCWRSAFCSLFPGWIGGRRCQAGGRHRSLDGLREPCFPTCSSWRLAGGMLATVFCALRRMPLPRCRSPKPGRCGCTAATGAFPTALPWRAALCVVYPQTVWFASLAV